MAIKNVKVDLVVDGDVTADALITDGGLLTEFVKGTGVLQLPSAINLSSFNNDLTYDNYNRWDLYTNGVHRLYITSDQVVDFVGGNAIDVGYSAGGIVTIDHTDTSSVSDVTPFPNTFIAGLTFDTYGHVATVTTDTIASDKYVSAATFATGTGVLDLNIANGTDVTVDLDGRYSLIQTYDYNSAALTGAVVFDDINVLNGFVDAISTRTLTLANLGYTGDNNANEYVLPLATNLIRGGVELFSNTDNPTAANAITSTASRTYGLQLNSSNQGVINVPWTDTVVNQNITLSGQVSGSGTSAITTVLTNTAITGQTAGTVLTGLDEFLYSDGGTIKRIDMNRFIVGQASSLTSGLLGTDELLISDGGVIKRMDVSVMNAYFNANLSFGSGDGIVESLTTTGTSGVATLIGSVLNIPNYANTTYTASNGAVLSGNDIRINYTGSGLIQTAPSTEGTTLLVTDTILYGDTSNADNVKRALVGDLPFDDGTGLEYITEGANSGWRLVGWIDANYGPIGNNAVDLSYSNTTSVLYGALGDYALAVGGFVEASGNYSAALGGSTIASGAESFAAGIFSEASGNWSFAVGYDTIANNQGSIAFGRFNSSSQTVGKETLFSLGNGTTGILRNNIFEITADGLIFAHDAIIADINTAVDEVLVTKGWIDDQGFGSGAGDVTAVTSATTNQLTVANSTGPIPNLSIVTGAVVNAGTALATGDQIYDFVTGLGYTSNIGDITQVYITAGYGLSGTSVDTTSGVHTQTLTVGEGNGIQILTGDVNIEYGNKDQTNNVIQAATVINGAQPTVPVATDEIIFNRNSTGLVYESKFSQIALSVFNNDLGITSPNNNTITLTAGNGIITGGAFTVDQSFNETITFTLGLPSSISGISTNNVSSTSHSHSITTGAVTNGGTAIPDGNDVYDFVTGLGYTSNIGDITGVTAGSGMAGGGTTGIVTLNVMAASGAAESSTGGLTVNTDTIAIEYGGIANNIIIQAAIVNSPTTSDYILYSDTSNSGIVNRASVGSLPFTNNTGTMSSWIIKEGNGTEVSTISNGETLTISQGLGILSELTSTISGGTLDISIDKTDVIDWQGQQYFRAQSYTISTSSHSWDLNTEQVKIITMTYNGAVTISNPTNQNSGGTYILIIKQSTNTTTLNWGNAFKFPGGILPDLTSGTGAVDIITFVSDGTTMYGTTSKDFQ